MEVDWERRGVTVGLLTEFRRFHSMLPSKGHSRKSQMCFIVQEREELSKRGHTQKNLYLSLLQVLLVDIDTSNSEGLQIPLVHCKDSVKWKLLCQNCNKLDHSFSNDS